MNGPVIDRRKVDLADFHDARSKGDAFWRVVVTTDDEYGLAEPCQSDKEIIKEGYGFSRRNTLVVDVAGKDDGIGLLGRCDAENLIKDELLFIKHAEFFDPLTNMQVAGV